jgi:hypothetical protein
LARPNWTQRLKMSCIDSCALSCQGTSHGRKHAVKLAQAFILAIGDDVLRVARTTGVINYTTVGSSELKQMCRKRWSRKST